MTSPVLVDRSIGCLVGAAVGDALGGATEGAMPEQIVARYGGWVDGIAPPFHADWRNTRPTAPYHKGDGHFTDDTLMTHALVRVYAAKRAHLDAFDITERLIPDLLSTSVYIPDMEREAVTLHRLAIAERFFVGRLNQGNADPREAGVGNACNCGAAMYMAPVGVVNASNPAGAYAEAIDISGTHQWSYGREAAGVFAAAVAEAMAIDSTVDSIIDAALDVAKDGTRAAIEAVCQAAEGYDDCAEAIAPLRAAMAPFDTVGEKYREPGLGARRASRVHAIEELPVALGLVRVAGGDYRAAVLGAVNYGRDSDSTATMAGAVCGAWGGESAVPDQWAREVSRASRTDLRQPGQQLARVAMEVHEADARAWRQRARRFAEFVPEGVGA